MCELFRVTFNFREFIVENLHDDDVNQEVRLSLKFMESIIQNENDESISLTNGNQKIKNNFQLQSNDLLNNENFAFDALGNQIEVKLIKESKKNKDNELIFAVGHIKLQEIVKNQEFITSSSILLKSITTNTDITLNYDINIENAPEINTTLSLQILSALAKENNFQVNFRFPFNKTSHPVSLQKSTNEISRDSLLIDKTLIENHFNVDENSFSIGFYYENYLTKDGLNLLHELIKNKQKMVIEVKMNNEMFMTFLDLDIFNYPGVNCVTFLVPLYQWNGKTILNRFQQEPCYEEKTKLMEESTEKTNDLEDLLLNPIVNEGKQVALKIQMKITKPFTHEKSIDELMQDLNIHFPFLSQKSIVDSSIDICKMEFNCEINKIYKLIEDFIERHSHLNQEDLMIEIKTAINNGKIFDKNELKDAVKAVIGNTFNQESKTDSNHEFKLLMIKVFKLLNCEMMRIINSKKQLKLKRSLINDKIVMWQIEEYIKYGDIESAEEIMKSELNEDINEEKLKKFAICLLKLRKYSQIEGVILKLLKISKYSSFAYYLLAYIYVEKENYSVAIIILNILIKLKPSMEFWIILAMLYEKIEFTCGVKYCNINIQTSRFLTNYGLNDSAKYPELISTDSFACIQWNQMKFQITKFVEFTKEFMRNNFINFEDSFEENFLKIVELSEDGKVQEVCEIIKLLKMTNENEISVRILKGNCLYDSPQKTKAICEYEIAFNLSLKYELLFPFIPTIRCGLFYLNEMSDTIKARKYFEYCCKNYETFESWMNLGIVNYHEEFYENAEKCFIKANQINKKSCKNWINLAIINCKLNRQNIGLKCYLMAKKYGINENDEVLIKVEKCLDI